MAAITPLAVAALGLLAERPMHPYEMFQLLVDREEDRLLKVRPGSLYHAVDRMAESGLVESAGTEKAGNRPERTRFRITELGRRALTERLTEMLAQPAPEYPEFPLAVGEAHNLPLPEVVACLRTRIKRLGVDQGRYAQSTAVEHLRTIPRRYWIDVDYLQAMRRAEISWLEGLVDELTSGALPWSDQPSSAVGPPADGPSRTGESNRPPSDRRPAVGAAEDDDHSRAGRRRGRPPNGSARAVPG